MTSRTISSPGTSRAACNLGAVILRFQIISYSRIAETIDSLVSSIELNGPAGITDSALSFWAVVMELRSRANPAQSQDMAKEICGWLKGVWTIGKAQIVTLVGCARLITNPRQYLRSNPNVTSSNLCSTYSIAESPDSLHWPDCRAIFAIIVWPGNSSMPDVVAFPRK